MPDRPKIYCFVSEVHEGRASGVCSVAIAEDGEPLTGHFSTNEEWAKHDMGVTSEWKHDVYKRHYPGGYEVVWLEDASMLPESVIERNRGGSGS